LGTRPCIRRGVRSPSGGWGLRRECLDWLLILGRGHLEQVLRQYVALYNRARPHRMLELRPPLARGQPARPTGRVEEVLRRDRLGGLIHEYEPVAA
jgi:putative transposase